MAEQPSMMEMLRQARDLQKKMKKIQKQVEKTEITAAAGDESNGQVTVVVSGKLHVRSITIDPRLLAPGNVRYVQDLVTNAVNAALEKAQEIMTGNEEGDGRFGSARRVLTSRSSIGIHSGTVTPDRAALEDARHRREDGGSPGVLHLEERARLRSRALRRHTCGQGEHALLQPLLGA